MKSERFNTGYLITAGETESMFLSVTPGFEHGPGIQRDGITAPRMTDPHSVARICKARNIKPDHTLPLTTDPYLQRAGTWTIYEHVKQFVEAQGEKWRVVGVQSCGDLTMNPWHVAYLGASHWQQRPQLCGLLLKGAGPEEPILSRTYRCLVKWKTGGAAPPRPFDWLDIHFEDDAQGGTAVITTFDSSSSDVENWLKEQKQGEFADGDITAFVEFVLSGKPVIEKDREIPLTNFIDRFQDVRHVFNLPTVPARGAYLGEPVKAINFGEYLLFRDLNARRAALSSAVIIDLNILNSVTVNEKVLTQTLTDDKHHFKLESPTNRGAFRKYADEEDKIEVFFPRNVYPFGVLGSHGKDKAIVCLASGGLSGQIGNTLEGITRIMYDFFRCSDAVVLDEGFDTFQIVNPVDGNDHYRFDNDTILHKILGFTKKMADQEHEKSLRDDFKANRDQRLQDGMKAWPLNKDLFAKIDKAEGIDDSSDIMAVAPHRSQMRSVLIFAARQPSTKRRSPRQSQN